MKDSNIEVELLKQMGLTIYVADQANLQLSNRRHLTELLIFPE